MLNRNNVNLIEVIDDYAYILESKNTNAYEEKLREAKSNMLINNMIHKKRVKINSYLNEKIQ